MESDLRVFSLQFGLSRKSHSCFTPESCSLLWLSSSSVRWEGLDFRAEAREAQLISDNLQLLNLNKEEMMERKIHSDKNHENVGKSRNWMYLLFLGQWIKENIFVVLMCFEVLYTIKTCHWRWKSRVSEVQSELFSVDFSCYMKVFKFSVLFRQEVERLCSVASFQLSC